MRGARRRGRAPLSSLSFSLSAADELEMASNFHSRGLTGAKFNDRNSFVCGKLILFPVSSVKCGVGRRMVSLSMKFNIVKEEVDSAALLDRSNENKKFRTQVSDGSANSNGQDFLLRLLLLQRDRRYAKDSEIHSH